MEIRCEFQTSFEQLDCLVIGSEVDSDLGEQTDCIDIQGSLPKIFPADAFGDSYPALLVQLQGFL